MPSNLTLNQTIAIDEGTTRNLFQQIDPNLMYMPIALALTKSTGINVFNGSQTFSQVKVSMQSLQAGAYRTHQTPTPVVNSRSEYTRLDVKPYVIAYEESKVEKVTYGDRVSTQVLVQLNRNWDKHVLYGTGDTSLGLTNHPGTEVVTPTATDDYQVFVSMLTDKISEITSKGFSPSDIAIQVSYDIAGRLISTKASTQSNTYGGWNFFRESMQSLGIGSVEKNYLLRNSVLLTVRSLCPAVFGNLPGAIGTDNYTLHTQWYFGYGAPSLAVKNDRGIHGATYMTDVWTGLQSTPTDGWEEIN